MSDSDRDAKIERLLLAGLDRYFAGEYEQAIDVWSRTFFLDRTHARARAYIERARSALAERQRESEELVHDGVAAYPRGNGEEARRLLTSALARGAPPDEALAVLDRIARLERGASRFVSADVYPNDQVVESRPTSSRPTGRARFALTALAAVVLLLAGAVSLRRSWQAWTSPVPAPSPATHGVPAPTTAGEDRSGVR